MNLTQSQVEALADGTRIVVTWSGGNGPHEYVYERLYGSPYAVLYKLGQRIPVGTLDMVGERPLTRVSLAP